MYDKLVVETFLEKQLKLFPEKVAASYEEAQEFLEDVCAVVCKNKKEVMDYLDEIMDISGMSEDEIMSSEEVFPISDGRYLIVEG